MKVEVVPHLVRCIITKEEMRAPQYKIYVDDDYCGVLPFHSGASPLMIKRFAPIELKEILRQVKIAVGDQEVGPIKQIGEEPKVKKRVSTARADFE